MSGPQAAVGPALLARVAPDVAKSAGISKQADLWGGPPETGGSGLRTVLLGYPEGYNYPDQERALAELEQLRAQGRPFTDLSRQSFDTLALSNHSYKNPSYTIMTALHRAGVPVDAYSLGDGPSRRVSMDTLRQVASDPQVGSVIQIGALHPDEANVIARSGKHFARMATDYGSGGFLQPYYHVGGNGLWGNMNGMLVDPAIPYSSVYIPGGNLKRWRGIPDGVHTVPVGRLAISPLFNALRFKQTPGSPSNVLMITGNSSGIGLPLEYRMLGGLGRFTDRSLMHPAPNLFDHLLGALRKKYGRDGFRLNYITGLYPNDRHAGTVFAPGDFGQLMRDSQHIYPSPSLNVSRDLWTMKEFLDPSSPAYQRIASTPEGSKFLQRLAERYHGLNLVGHVGLPEMGRYYSNADTIVALPGSSVGEIASIGGQKSPGMIHLIPRETSLYPRHFRGNAEATNILMQPRVRDNIVSIASPTLAQDIDRAVQASSGLRDWGRAPIMSSTESMSPLVRDIQRAHWIRANPWAASTLGRLRRLPGGAFGKVMEALRWLRRR